MAAPQLSPASAAPDRGNRNAFHSAMAAMAASISGYPSQTTAIEAFMRTNTAPAIPKWVAGAFSEDDAVYSPTRFLTYRAKNDIASSLTDPASDSTNWQLTGGLATADKASLDLMTVPNAVNLDTRRRGKFRTSEGSGSAGDVVARQSDGTIKVVTTGNANADGWLFIAAEDFTDGQSVRVWGKGDIATGLTGLTYDATYYVDDDGGLTVTSSGGRKIGLALSTTELLITEINA